MAKRAKNHSAITDGPFPLHRGPFLFAPRFLTKFAWFPEFHSLATAVLNDLGLKGNLLQFGETDRCAMIEFEKTELVIDGEGGVFALFERGFTASKSEDHMSHEHGPIGCPDQFFSELRELEETSFFFGDRKPIESFSSQIYRRMERRFEYSLRAGIAEISARVGSPISPPTVLDFRLLEYLEFRKFVREAFLSEDLDLDEAKLKNGTPLFLVGVAPTHRKAETSSTPPVGRGRQEKFPKDQIVDAIVAQLRLKGLPSDSTPAWTWEKIWRAVQEAWGQGDLPSRNTILGKKIPAIEKYKMLRTRK
jgi:hypothetical protein